MRLNLAKRRFISDNMCLDCTKSLESMVHALWDCKVATDVEAGSLVKL